MNIVDGKVHITVGEFLDNMEENGYEQHYLNLFRLEDEVKSSIFRRFGADYIPLSDDIKIIAACAFGQALINSSAKTDVVKWKFDDGNPNGFYHPVADKQTLLWRLYEDTFELNDERGLSVPDIGATLKSKYADELEEVLVFDYFDYKPFLKES